jgi:hypothetical protein
VGEELVGVAGAAVDEGAAGGLGLGSRRCPEILKVLEALEREPRLRLVQIAHPLNIRLGSAILSGD